MHNDPELQLDGPSNASRTIVLAHGAGGGMDSPFMNFFAKGLAGRGFQVARFEFPYMAAFTRTGKKRPPDRAPVLRATWLKVVTCLAVSAVPHGATPAQRSAQAVITAMASNGPSTMIGRASLLARVTRLRVRSE